MSVIFSIFAKKEGNSQAIGRIFCKNRRNSRHFNLSSLFRKGILLFSLTASILIATQIAVVFAEPGSKTDKSTFYPTFKETPFNKPLQAFVSNPPPVQKLKATITPSPARVKQGKSITFTANLNYPLKAVYIEWEGARQKKGTGLQYKVNTAHLPPGSYPITLKGVLTGRDDVYVTNKLATTILTIEPKVIRVTVPNVIHDNETVARQKIKKAQLKVGKIKVKDVISGKDKQVYQQRPRANNTVPLNSSVDLWVTKRKPSTISVNIIEDQISITQGDIAIFNAEVSPKNLSLSWKGANNFSDSKSYKINTQNLSVRSYTVTLFGEDKTTGDVKKDTAVLIVKQPPPKPIIVPHLIGLSRHQAKESIKRSKLKTGNITHKTVSTGKDNIVLAQNPAEKRAVPVGTPIDLTLSKFTHFPLIIDIQPKTLQAARGDTIRFKVASKSNSKNLTYSWTGAGETSRNAEFLINTDALKPDTNYTIDLTVKDNHQRSKHAQAKLYIQAEKATPEPEVVFVSVPNLIGMDMSQAVATLNKNKLKLGAKKSQTIVSGQSGNVLEQFPPPLSDVAPGSSVDLTIGQQAPVTDTSPHTTTPSKKISLSLRADKSYLLSGQQADFYVKSGSKDNKAIFQLFFENGESSQRSSKQHFTYQFFQTGKQSVYAKAEIKGNTYLSNKVNIWVIPAWLSYVLGGLGLLGVGTAISKASPSRSIKVKQPPHISVNATLDSGIQNISALKIPKSQSAPELTFEFDYGLPGNQSTTEYPSHTGEPYE